MRNDLQIQKDVMEEMRWDPSFNAAEIGVAVHNGVVTLSGHVDTYAQKRSAEKAAKRVAGVKAVAEELQVGLVAAHSQTDTEIANTVKETLKWHAGVEDNRINAMAKEGAVTLTGEVEWEYQRRAIVKVISKLVGVRAVIDQIKILPKTSPEDLEMKIKSAMERNARLDSERIAVSIADGKVQLDGKVRSFSESKDAEDAAWAAPGVVAVANKLDVEELINYF